MIFKRISLILFFAVAILSSVAAQAAIPGEAPDVACPALDVPYARLAITQAQAWEFARSFQEQTGITVGFMETDSEDPQESTARFSFSATDATPRDVLTAWSAENVDFIWFPVSQHMINILPVAHFTDPASPLNALIPRLEAQDVPARDALMLVSPFTRDTPRHAKFSIGGGLRIRTASGLPYRASERPISLDVADVTVREALNEVCHIAGGGMGWSWRGKVLNPIQTKTKEVVPAVLAEARLKAKTDSFEEAIAAYERARMAPMPEHMRLLAGIEMAQLALGEGRTEDQTRPDVAVDLLLELLRGSDKGLGLWRNWAIETLVEHADAAGRGQAAKQLLAQLSEQSEAADDLTPETRKLLKDSLPRVR